MAVVSTVCPLDLNSRDQLQLIACEANHLMGDYPKDPGLLERLERLKAAALELKEYWDARQIVKTPKSKKSAPRRT